MALTQALVVSYPNAASSSADPYFNDVVLLMDVSSTGGTITDIKNNTIIENIDNVSTNGPFTGTYAYDHSGSGEVRSSTLTFNTSNAWTIEGWIKPVSFIRVIKVCSVGQLHRQAAHGRRVANQQL